jgi:hypothetical protein
VPTGLWTRTGGTLLSGWLVVDIGSDGSVCHVVPSPAVLPAHPALARNAPQAVQGAGWGLISGGLLRGLAKRAVRTGMEQIARILHGSKRRVPALFRHELPNAAECDGKKPHVLMVCLVLPVRIELTTSPLPRECSTTELRQRDGLKRGNIGKLPKPRDPCHRVPRGASWRGDAIRAPPGLGRRLPRRLGKIGCCCGLFRKESETGGPGRAFSSGAAREPQAPQGPGARARATRSRFAQDRRRPRGRRRGRKK